MPFYTGKTADGSDMEEVQGMYVSPDGKEWSNHPYPTSREDRLWGRIYAHLCDNHRSMNDEYELILRKASLMPRAERDHLKKLIEDDKMVNKKTLNT